MSVLHVVQEMNVIERTHEDITRETKELFQACKPYLDDGVGFYEACHIVLNIPETSCIGNRSWYKRFRDYAITQGYKPRSNRRKREC